MFCTQCGAENPAGTRFCTSCGAALPVPAGAAPAAQAGQGLPSAQIVDLCQYAMPAGGLLMAIGVFLPWVTANFLGYTDSINGFDVGARGVLVFVLGLLLIGGYAALRLAPSLLGNRDLRRVVIVALAVIAVATIAIVATVGGDLEEAMGLAKVGFGAYLAVAGSLLAVVSGVWLWPRS